MDERAEKEAKREDEERGRAWIGMDGREHHACAQSMRGVGRSRKHIARGRSGFSFMGSISLLRTRAHRLPSIWIV